jgi:hypothetical protein
MKFFGFVAGFFRNQAQESSTRLVGILACAVGLALAAVLIVRSCTGTNATERDISWTDIVVVFGVFAYSCTALGLRSPFPTELLAPPGTSVKVEETAKVETTKTTEVQQ